MGKTVKKMMMIFSSGRRVTRIIGSLKAEAYLKLKFSTGYPIEAVVPMAKFKLARCYASNYRESGELLGSPGMGNQQPSP